MSVLRKKDSCAHSSLLWPPVETWLFIRGDAVMLDARGIAPQDKSLLDN